MRIDHFIVFAARAPDEATSDRILLWDHHRWTRLRPLGADRRRVDCPPLFDEPQVLIPWRSRELCFIFPCHGRETRSHSRLCSGAFIARPHFEESSRSSLQACHIVAAGRKLSCGDGYEIVKDREEKIYPSLIPVKKTWFHFLKSLEKIYFNGAEYGFLAFMHRTWHNSDQLRHLLF